MDNHNMGFDFSFSSFTYYNRRFQMTGSLGDVFQEFDRLRSSPTLRFKYVRQLLIEHDMLPTRLLLPQKEIMFNHEMTDMMRRDGNAHFHARSYMMALNSYTRCVVGTEPGTVRHAYALANRSAAFFHLRRYEYCLADIRRAIAAHYPSQLLYKLYERAGHAEYNLGRGEKAILNYKESLRCLDDGVMKEEQRFQYKKLLAESIRKCDGLVEHKVPVDKCTVEKLTGGSHPYIPALSKLVHMVLIPTMGRGLAAAEDISPGDVVAIEEPFISGASPHNSLLCYNYKCLKLTCSVIPCPHCSLVYYCGEECMKKAFESWHKLECPIMFSINSLPGDNKVNQLAIRWFASEYLQQNLLDYYLLVRQFLENKPNLTIRGFNKSYMYKSDNFVTAFNMHTDINNPISMDLLLFYYCLGAEMMEYWKLTGIHIPDYYLNTFGASLVRMLIILDTYCRKLTVNAPCISAKLNKRTDVVIAYALYPTIYLFNHSCDPNVRSSGDLSDRIRVMKAIQPIPKGSQLFISYGEDFKEKKKSIRNSNLFDLYRFSCECQACDENWPIDRFIPIRLTSLNLLNMNEAEKLMRECKKFDEFTATDVFIRAPHLHLTYLYDFLKLLFGNVKRPFKLYESCVTWISTAHISLSEEQSALSDLVNT